MVKRLRSETWPLLFLYGEVNYILEHLKKRGRPPKPDAKKRKISVRVKCTDVEMLDFLMSEKDMTPTEVFELGLRMAYNLKKYT